MTTKLTYNSLLAQKIIEEFSKRNIEGHYCETKETGLENALELISKGSVVSHGGSKTLHEIGLCNALKNGNFNFLDPIKPKNGIEKEAVAHQALNSDYYFMSSNAITMAGQLVNIDGIGNRVASLIYGPKNVIVIAGMNKITENVDEAIKRIKNYSAPMGILSYKNDFTTFDELIKASEFGQSQLVITEYSMIKHRIKVILVGEDLGF